MVTVGKQEAVLYTWDNALGKRELVWTCGKKKDVKTDLTQVGRGGHRQPPPHLFMT